MTQQRHIRLEGPGNFRDLGGYATAGGQQVRWRTVFRSDGLETLSPRDRQVVLEELRVGVVVDLRSPREVTDRGTFPLEADAQVLAVRLCPVPVFDDASGVVEQVGASRPGGFRMAHLLTYMIESCSDRLVGALRLLAEVEEPVVFHCAAGKDRTGLLAALLLGVLGVDDADILTDYGYSRRAVPLLRKRWLERDGGAPTALAGDTGAPPSAPAAAAGVASAPEAAEELLSAEPATLAEALAFLRQRHGSIERWATDHGATTADLQRLRHQLLEPDSAVRPAAG